MEQKTYNKILEKASKKYQKYKISLDVLRKLLTSISDKDYNTQLDLFADFYLLIENYIINEIRNNNIDYQIIVIDENSVLKTIILKNQKYRNSSIDLNKVYDNAIDKMIDDYDSSILISQNILKQMKKILINDNKSEKISNDNKEIKLIKEDTSLENKETDIIIRLSNEYISETKMTKTEFAKLLGVNRVTVLKYLNKKVMLKSTSVSILKYFDAESVNDLNLKVQLKIKKYKEEYVDEKAEILNLLLEYMKETNKSKEQLASEIGISRVSICRYILGRHEISPKVIEKILKEFNAKTLDELKLQIEKKIEEYKNEKIKKLKNEIDNYEKGKILEEMEGESKALDVKEDKDNDILKLINIDILYNLLDDLLSNNSISKQDYIISWLLFGRNNKIYYSKEKISEFLDIDIEYINKVYVDILKIYRNYFDNLLENITKLELKNNDI